MAAALRCSLGSMVSRTRRSGEFGPAMRSTSVVAKSSAQPKSPSLGWAVGASLGVTFRAACFCASVIQPSACIRSSTRCERTSAWSIP